VTMSKMFGLSKGFGVVSSKAVYGLCKEENHKG
jgi:hypothetical protein